MDEKADSGDDEDHDDGELVHLKIEADAQIVVRHDPVEEFLAEGLLTVRRREFAHGFQRGQERQSRWSQAQPRSRCSSATSTQAGR